MADYVSALMKPTNLVLHVPAEPDIVPMVITTLMVLSLIAAAALVVHGRIRARMRRPRGLRPYPVAERRQVDEE